jgi:PTS system fructose-specific IIC component
MSDLVLRYLREDRVLLRMTARKKAEGLRELAALVEDSVEIPNFRQFLSAVFQKESRFGSGVGEGVALPHYRDEKVEEPVICLGVSKNGIDWGEAEWGEKEQVHILVLVAWPYTHEDNYLKTVAEIARLLRMAPVREKIRKAGAPSEVLAAFQTNGAGKARVAC